MPLRGFDIGLDYQCAVPVVTEYILSAIRSADEIKETEKFYEIPCDFGSIRYPRDGGYVQFYMDGGKLSSKSFDKFIASVVMYYWLCKVKFEPDKYPEHRDKHISEIQKKLKDQPYHIVITSKHDIEFYTRKFERDPKNYVKISARGKNISKAELFVEYLKTRGFVVESIKNEERQCQVLLKKVSAEVKQEHSRTEINFRAQNIHQNLNTEPRVCDPFRDWDYDPKKIRWKVASRYD